MTISPYLISHHTQPEVSVENLYRTFEAMVNSIKLDVPGTEVELNHDIKVICRWLSAVEPHEVTK